MKPSEIRAKGEKELLKTAQEKTAELFGLRLQRSVGQLAKTASVKTVKKDIARILTIMREKELHLHTEERKTETQKHGETKNGKQKIESEKRTKKTAKKGK